jgi:hypothetical protein
LGSSPQEEREWGDDEDTNDDIFDGKAREEEKRSQRAGIPIRFSFHHHIFSC